MCVGEGVCGGRGCRVCGGGGVCGERGVCGVGEEVCVGGGVGCVCVEGKFKIPPNFPVIRYKLIIE